MKSAAPQRVQNESPPVWPGVSLALVAVLVAAACGLRWDDRRIGSDLRYEVWAWRMIVVQDGQRSSVLMLMWTNVPLALGGVAALLAAVLFWRTRGSAGSLVVGTCAASVVAGIGVTRVCGLSGGGRPDASSFGAGYWALVAATVLAGALAYQGVRAIDQRVPRAAVRTDRRVAGLLAATAVATAAGSVMPFDISEGMQQTSWATAGPGFSPTPQLLGVGLVCSALIAATAAALLVTGRAHGRGYALGIGAGAGTFGSAATIVIDTIADVLEPRTTGPGTGWWALVAAAMLAIATSYACITQVKASRSTTTTRRWHHTPDCRDGVA